MPRVSQGLQNIKHLVLLRKALMGKSSIEIYSREPSMSLTIADGLLHGGGCVEAICTMIEQPLLIFYWENLEEEVLFIAQNPRQIFSQVLDKIEPNKERLKIYMRIFSRLPRVRIRHYLSFNGDKAVQAEYQILYRFALTEDGASLANYFKGASSYEQLKRRIGIVTASYCLNHFVAVESLDKQSQKTSIIERIMARLRKL
ncbi:MAG: hypothetical protein Q9M20_03640 [Mariprofundaceae bacterium]|nr:hypothetical protein [Mariprofundaceae bacterium]